MSGAVVRPPLLMFMLLGPPRAPAGLVGFQLNGTSYLMTPQQATMIAQALLRRVCEATPVSLETMSAELDAKF